MTTTATRDRLRTLIDVLVDSLEDPARGDELARCAYLSRFHFDRLVAAGLGEAPAEFRRRLLLERAANAAGLRSVSCASDTSGPAGSSPRPSVESAIATSGTPPT